MQSPNHTSTLAIFAHPGHELRALGALGRLDADVVYLTDASASTGESRIALSRETLEPVTRNIATGFMPVPERDVHRALLTGDNRALADWTARLSALIKARKPACIITDSAEGYNPVHDLCHFMVMEAARTADNAVSVFDIALNDDPAGFANAREQDCRVFDLTAEELHHKMWAIEDYTVRAGPVLRREAVGLLERDGGAGLAREILRPAMQLHEYAAQFDAEPPFFEIHGRKRVAEGKYKNALTLKDHILPALESLGTAACMS